MMLLLGLGHLKKIKKYYYYYLTHKKSTLNKAFNLINNFCTEFQDDKVKRLHLAQNSRGFCQYQTEQVRRNEIV